MRLFLNREDKLTWRNIPAIILYIAVILIAVVIIETLKHSHLWRQIIALPWWWQLAVRTAGFGIIFGLYASIMYGKGVRFRDTPVFLFRAGIFSILIGAVAAAISFLPWWVFLLLLLLSTVVTIWEWLKRQRRMQSRSVSSNE